MNLKKQSISTKVLIPWFLLLFLYTGLIIFRINQAELNFEREDQSVLHRQMVLLVKEIQFNQENRWLMALQYLFLKDPEIPGKISRNLDSTESLNSKLKNIVESDKYSDQLSKDKSMAILESYFIARTGTMELYDKFIVSITEGDVDQEKKLIYILDDKFKMVNAALDDLSTYHIKLEDKIKKEQLAANKRFEYFFFSFWGIIIICGIIFFRYQIFTIVSPIKLLTKSTHAMVQGKETNFSIFHGKDEIGQLSFAFSQLISSLKSSNLEILEQREKLEKAYDDVELQVKERTMELEEINRELESFSYTVSHDLRAPLRSLTGFANLLQKRSSGSLDDKCEHYVEVISESAIQMGKLIDDLLSFSKLSRSGMMNTAVDPNMIIQSILPMYEKESREQNIKWRIQSLPEVQGDSALLKQVFANLIDNAVKYTGKQAEPVIDIGYETRENDKYIFYVGDNGVGFDMQYKDMLFNVFQRLHREKEFEGTGIGLASVRRIITRHGGECWAEGSPNNGAIFYFTLNKRLSSKICGLVQAQEAFQVHETKQFGCI